MKRTCLAALAAFAAASALAHGPGEHAGHAAPAASHGTHAEETAFGREGDPAKVDRTIAISMSDAMRYDPAHIRVRQGETVRLVVTNEGKTLHEIVLGTKASLREHAVLMKRFPDMHHEEPHMAHVNPGETQELVWQFTKRGTFYYGCLIPGHYDAGMVGEVVVAKR